MFTGLIEDVGTLTAITTGPGGGRILEIKTALDPATLCVGDSIATSGVCLTVTRLKGNTFSVDVGPETLLRTSLGALSAGARVNLERSVTLATRLGGHLVQGHVDATGKLSKVTRRENAYDLEIEAPPEVLKLAVPRGSIAVDGISLTITQRTERIFGVMIIPHTWQVTTLSDRRIGDLVNLEADLIARYVAGLLEFRGGDAPSPGLTQEFLEKHGF